MAQLPTDIYIESNFNQNQRINNVASKVNQIQEDILPTHQYWLNINQHSWDMSSQLIRDFSFSMNSGKLGGNLTSTQLLANSGFLTTLDPAPGLTDSGLRFPPLQYDYVGEESIVIFWKGIITPEASNQFFIGDTVSGTTQGFALRVDTAGTCSLMIGNASGGLFGGNSSKICFDGTLHSFAVLLDGANRTIHWYVDGEPVTEKPLVFSFGQIKDSISKFSFNVGSVAAAPGTTAGIATKTQSLQIFRKYGKIDKASAYQILNQLHIDPFKQVKKAF